MGKLDMLVDAMGPIICKALALLLVHMPLLMA